MKPKAYWQAVFIHTASILLGTLLCIRNIGGIDIPLQIQSLLAIIIVLAGIYHKPHPNINLPVSLFILVYGLTLVIHPHNEPALRTMRFIAFMIGMAFFSPLFESRQLDSCRKLAARSIYVTLSLMVFLSFLVWIYILTTKGIIGIQCGEFHYYGFRGIFKMGMTLSPASAVVALISFFRLLQTNNRNERAIMAAMGLLGIIMCIVGGSRSALLALFLSLTILIFHKRNQIAKFLKKPSGIILSLGALLAIALSLPTALDAISRKYSISTEHGSILYSREKLWENRIDEFRSSPVIGIGYANEFPSDNGATDNLAKIEPGSSWLSLLSYGGISGTAVFLWVMVMLVKKIWRNRNSTTFPLVCSMLVFLIINGTTEGWLMFAGAMMFPIFWLTVSAGWKSGNTNRSESTKNIEDLQIQ